MVRKILYFCLIVPVIISSCNLSPGKVLGEFINATATPTLLPTATPLPTKTPSPTSVPVVRVTQGDRVLAEGDYEKALAEFQLELTAAEDTDAQAAALAGMGRSQFLNGDYLAAIQSLLTVIENYPESDQIALSYYYLGRAYDILEQYEDASEAYEQYIRVNPGILDGYFHEYIANSYLNAGNIDFALSEYEKAINSNSHPDPLSIQVKIADIYNQQGQYDLALEKYWLVYENSSNDYLKAQMDYLIGELYMILEDPGQAYARFQDAVIQFPKSYHAYLSLLILLENNQPVDDFFRGLVDFYAGQYGMAINSFDRYMDINPSHDGTGHYYKGLAYRALEQAEDAISEWDFFIKNYPENSLWENAWDEKAYTQWAYLQKHQQAAQTLLDLVSQRPESMEAPEYVFEAGRIYERNGDLLEAAAIWERMMVNYPENEISFRGLFLSGIIYYRLDDNEKALNAFQRALVLATNPKDQSAAYLWIGKTQRKQNDFEGAYASWEQAALRDPTGYYSERARDILLDRPAFTQVTNYDLGYDLETEREEAENWMRLTFFLDENEDISSPGELLDDPRIKRGINLWELGLYQQSLDQFDLVIEESWLDPVQCFRLLDILYDLGYYRKAILISRQILDLANLDDVSTLNAPMYFNHIRFGAYYKELVLPAAQNYGINPLLLFSVIRQESLFEGFISSSAGAQGLMQLMPATAEEIVNRLDWPPDYSEADLNRPVVNIPLGAEYLATQRDLFDGNLVYALAAYNAGPGNAQTWAEMSEGDSDLFLEIIRFNETRAYIMQIAEFLNIYRTIYFR